MKNWYEIPGNENDVVVSTRVRLARNFAEYPFEPHLTEAQEKEICAKLQEIYSDGWTYTDFAALPATEKRSYSEKHLVSPAFAEKTSPCALLSKNSVYIMALEEDHLRIQSIYPGLALDEAWHDAAEADRLLDEGANVAYTEKLGYLTHCPTNLGTGMRASVMLFLPAYTAAHGIQALASQLSKIGLTIRGMYGEGSGADGCLYQISNQITLGITEEETIRKLETVVRQVIENERKLRERQDKEALADRASRTLGILRYAKRMDSSELLSLYTTLRLGASMKLLDDITPTMADTMLIESMPGTLTVFAKLGNDPASRDKARAARIQQILQ